MKSKSKIALAVLGTLATLSVAHAQSAPVEIYGNLDIGVNHFSSAGQSRTGVDTNLSSPSFLGFRGSESLGQGLTAKFNIETGINMDTGAQTLPNYWGRQAWVGVAGGFGEVRLGTTKTPLRKTMEALDVFDGQYLPTTVFGGTTSTRTSNAITYATPTVNGLSGELQYSFGEVADSMQSNRTVSGSVSYAINDLRLHAAMTDKNVGLNSTRDYVIGGTYDMKVVQLRAGYGNQKVEGAADSADSWFVGAHIPVSSNSKVMASYTQHDFKTGAQSTTSQFAVGYQYDLSKRTSVYGHYAHQNNEDNVGLNASAVGANSNSVSVGLRHRF